MLLGAAGRARVAVRSEQRKLVVHELCGADLDRVFRLQLVRGGVLGEPKSRVSRLHHLLFLLLQHDDFLLPLL